MDNVLQLLQTVIVICIVLSALLLISLGISIKAEKKHTGDIQTDNKARRT